MSYIVEDLTIVRGDSGEDPFLVDILSGRGLSSNSDNVVVIVGCEEGGCANAFRFIVLGVLHAEYFIN